VTRADKASTGLFGWIRVGSGTHGQHEDDTSFGALWRTLRRDGAGLAALAAIAALAALAAAAPFVGALEPWARAAAFLRPACALLALAAGISRLARGWERRLWAEIAGAVVLWGLAWALLALAAAGTVVSAVAAGALFAAAFVALLSALARPARRRGWSGTVFALGLFIYFALVSAAVDVAVDAVYRQLLYMLVVLDLFAIGKLIHFGGVTRAPRWRMLYSLLALTMIGVLVNDAILLLRLAGVVPRSGVVYGLGWSVPLVFLVLAARLRHHPFASEDSDSERRGGEESRRRDQERADAQARRISEEKLFKAWRSIPDAMLISTVAEGRILEVNDGFLRQFDYERDEVLGKTGVELRLWVEPEDRAMMTRLLRERGAVRNLAFELTRKSGEKRLTLLSGEIVDLEGKACFVMVLRDVTELKSLELASQ
jgi:PAS domain S-box-containing protein